jgi:hypothetical protein
VIESPLILVIYLALFLVVYVAAVIIRTISTELTHAFSQVFPALLIVVAILMLLGAVARIVFLFVSSLFTGQLDMAALAVNVPLLVYLRIKLAWQDAEHST